MKITRWKTSTLLVVAAFLIGAPLLLDQWYVAKQQRRDLRDDELVRQYECEPPEECVADFDGDGTLSRITVEQINPAERFDLWLKVYENGRELLRLPYDHTDNTLRTHTAIHNEAGKSRLLVYDKVSRTDTVAVFAWDGNRLAEVPPSSLEQEILSAMAAYDDTGGWNERTVFRPFFRTARLFGYYALLTVVIGMVLYRRYRNPISRLP